MNVQLLTQFILEVCHNCLTEYPVGLKLCRTTLAQLNIVIFAIRAAVSEIQLVLTLNGKLALIGY